MKKKRMINLTSIFDEVYSYVRTLESTWLFPSRKGKQPISKIQAYRQLQKSGDFAGVESIGTHTMRKTFGYWFYKQKISLCCKKYSITAQHNTNHIDLYWNQQRRKR